MPESTDIQLVLAEMKAANALTADLVAAQLVTQAAQEQAAQEAKKAADYAEQRLAVERGFFMDVGTLLIEVRASNDLMRNILNQTPLTDALAEFTGGAEGAIRNINYKLETVLLFMQSAVPHLSTMEKEQREALNRQLKRAINTPKLDSLRAQLKEWDSTLNTLLEQEASYGGELPVGKIHQLDKARGRVLELTEEIKELA